MKLSLIQSRFSKVQSYDHALGNVGDETQDAAKRSGLCQTHI